MGRPPILAALLVAALATTAPAAERPLTGYPASLGEVLARFPSAEANRAALDLEALSAAIGIDLAPRSLQGRSRPALAERQRFDALKPALGEYLTAELQRPGGAIDTPPEPLVTFLADERTGVEAIRARLLTGETPSWERHIERLADAPIPNVLGHITLQKVLVLAALERGAAGESADALLYLDASWHLNGALRDEPTLFTQLIAVSVARMQAGALRRVPDVPEIWIERLREHDHRASMTTALWMEGWIWTQLDVPPDSSLDDGGWVRQALLAAGRPYFRLCLDEASERWAAHLERLARVTSLCDGDVTALDAELVESTPWWNAIAGTLFSNLSGVLERVGRLEVDLEMTSLILDIQSHRRRTGDLSDALPSAASTACPSSRWRYAREDGGRFGLELDRTIDWGSQLGVMLPLRYEG